jgi:chemotaxis response regulator CheB
MPRAALQAGTVDRVLPLDIIAPTLIELVGSGDPT